MSSRAAPSPPAAAAVPTGTPRAGAQALTVLGALRVAPDAPDGYRRALFGAAWTDDSDAPLGHNGCRTRDDVLRRDLADAVLEPGSRCVVMSGVLHDPYTGTTVRFTRGERTSAAVQIDHVVSLGNAYATGARDWGTAERVALANDPLNLLAVAQHSNEAKGDQDAASWLPPDRAYDCAYVARQIAVKARYRLAVSPAERNADDRVLAACPQQRVPSAATSATPPQTSPTHRDTTSAPARAPASTPVRMSAPRPSCHPLTSGGNCYRAGERCRAADHGVHGVAGNGDAITCADNNGWRWEST